MVVVDCDTRDCVRFLRELDAILRDCHPAPRTLFRLAIEETEAWYFGDHDAITTAYPHAKRPVLDSYEQDSQRGTWERLADALYPGGAAKLIEEGWPRPGEVKCEWARMIAPRMDPSLNESHSFGKFRDGLRRLAEG